MKIRTNTIRIVTLLLAILSIVVQSTVFAQKKDSDQLSPAVLQAAERASKSLWENPVDLEHRNLFYGPGGKEGAPNPAGRFTFIRRSTGGTQKKIIVKDEAGREWTVKFGPEVRPETAATRILWAVGYYVDQDYVVERARINGYKENDLYNVRFERRDDGSKELANWSWDSNPFIGTRELEGLKVLIALLKNLGPQDHQQQNCAG